MHPLHVSVTNIEYKPENESFIVSIKLFTDDFEQIILKKYNEKLNLGSDNENSKTSELINNYVKEHLLIQVNNTKNLVKNVYLVKKEMNVEAVWLYYEIPFEEKISDIKIRNTLMTDLFTDQRNLVFLVCGNTEKAEMYNNTEIEKKFKID